MLQFNDRGCVVIRGQPINRKKNSMVLSEWPDEECLGKAASRTGEKTKGCLENRYGQCRTSREQRLRFAGGRLDERPEEA
mgnify:CR=1 FL=1